MDTLIFLDDESKCNNFIRFKKSKIILKNKKIHTSTSIHDYALDFKENKEFYKIFWLQKWAANIKLQGNKTIKDFLIYKNQSLWYLIEYFLYVDMGEAIPFNPTSRILYYIDVINEIFKKENPKEVIIQNKEDALYKLIKDIC